MTFLWKVDNQLLDNWIEGHDRVLIEMWYVFLWHKLRQFFEYPIYYNTIYVSSCAAQDECVHVLASSKGQARCRSAQHAARHTVCLHLHSLINKYPRLLDRWNSTLTLACLSEYNKKHKEDKDRRISCCDYFQSFDLCRTCFLLFFLAADVRE